MPDRNDPTQYGYMNELGDFADFPTGVPDGAPDTHHDMFDDKQTYDLETGDVQHGQPYQDILADHPEQFFTAYRDKVRNVPTYRPLPFGSGLFTSGQQFLAGWSTFYPNVTGGYIVLRDGLDISAPAVMVIVPGLSNQWFGMDGVRFKFGIYADLSTLVGSTAGAVGSLFTVKEYAE